MRKLMPILILLAVMACEIDEPDMRQEPSFSKVYGLDGDSYGLDFVEMPNGDFVIVGNVRKESQIGTNFYGDDTRGPFILRTDANGNQVQFRNFFITRGSLPRFADYLKLSWGLTDLDTIVYNSFSNNFITDPQFQYVVLLNNGNFFITGSMIGRIGGILDAFYFTVIMDQNFNPLNFNFLNNSNLELDSGIYATGKSTDPKPIQNDNGEIFIIRGNQYLYWWDEEPSYGIHKFDNTGKLVNTFEIPLKKIGPIRGESSPHSWTLKDLDTVIVTGTYSLPDVAYNNVILERDNDIWIQKVELNTGTVVTEKNIGVGYYNYNSRGGIQITDSGFVLGDYHMHRIGQEDDFNDDGYRNIFGGLWFVDGNLDSLGHKDITYLEVEDQIGRLTKTIDNGYVAAYRRVFDKTDVLIVKVDSNGEVLWRRNFEIGFDGIDNTEGGRVPISKMIGTRDGGIAILANLNFNSMGNRMQLIKLDANGNY